MINASELRLPAAIHAAVISERHISTGQLMQRGVVWADRTYRTCETCRQPVPYAVEQCPVTLDQVGAVREWSQAHCDFNGPCGTWQPVLWEAVNGEPTTASMEDAARSLATRRAEVLAGQRTMMTASLRDDLQRALSRIAHPDPGENAEQAAEAVTTGSDAEPGVYFDAHSSGEWVAWDYDPGDESETITVYASDLGA